MLTSTLQWVGGLRGASSETFWSGFFCWIFDQLIVWENFTHRDNWLGCVFFFYSTVFRGKCRILLSLATLEALTPLELILRKLIGLILLCDTLVQKRNRSSVVLSWFLIFTQFVKLYLATFECFVSRVLSQLLLCRNWLLPDLRIDKNDISCRCRTTLIQLTYSYAVNASRVGSLLFFCWTNGVVINQRINSGILASRFLLGIFLNP